MNKRTVTIKYTEFKIDEINALYSNLLSKALSSSVIAYAPYSNFNVGVAVLLSNNEIIAANNQENAAYPSGMCAERIALYSAKAQYPSQKIIAVAIVALHNNKEVAISPCGACRQVIAEYEHAQNEQINIIFKNDKSSIIEIKGIDNLLPFIFNKTNLNKK